MIATFSSLSEAAPGGRYRRGTLTSSEITPRSSRIFSEGRCELLDDSSPSTSSFSSFPMDEVHSRPTSEVLELPEKIQTEKHAGDREDRVSVNKLMNNRDNLILDHLGDVISYYQSQLRSGIFDADKPLEREGIHVLLDKEDEEKHMKNENGTCEEENSLIDRCSSSNSTGSTYSTASVITSSTKSEYETDHGEDNSTESNESEPTSLRTKTFALPKKKLPSKMISSNSSAVRKSQNIEHETTELLSNKEQQSEKSRMSASSRARQLWAKARPPSLALKLENSGSRNSVSKDISPYGGGFGRRMSVFQAMMKELREQQEGIEIYGQLHHYF